MAKRPRDLPIPDAALDDPDAVELARVWNADGAHLVSLRVAVPDADAWGYTLADLARHIAIAYERKGLDPRTVLRQIRNAFLDELTESGGDTRVRTIGKTPKPARRATSRAGTKPR